MNGIVVDRLADHGLRLARFSETTRDALSAVMLPDHLDNPVDMGTRRQEVGEVRRHRRPRSSRRSRPIPMSVSIMIPLTTTPNYEVSVTALAEALKSAASPRSSW